VFGKIGVRNRAKCIRKPKETYMDTKKPAKKTAKLQATKLEKKIALHGQGSGRGSN
jgi:hypothetical protein